MGGGGVAGVESHKGAQAVIGGGGGVAGVERRVIKEHRRRLVGGGGCSRSGEERFRRTGGGREEGGLGSRCVIFLVHIYIYIILGSIMTDAMHHLYCILIQSNSIHLFETIVYNMQFEWKGAGPSVYV